MRQTASTGPYRTGSHVGWSTPTPTLELRDHRHLSQELRYEEPESNFSSAPESRYENQWKEPDSYIRYDGELPETTASRQPGLSRNEEYRERQHELDGRAGLGSQTVPNRGPRPTMAEAGAARAWSSPTQTSVRRPPVNPPSFAGPPTQTSVRPPPVNPLPGPALNSAESALPASTDAAAHPSSESQHLADEPKPGTFLNITPEPSNTPYPAGPPPWNDETSLKEDPGLRDDRQPLPPSSPTQNEGRRRTGRTPSDPDVPEAVSTPPAPPPLPDATPGDTGIMEARIRAFLKTHNVTEQTPGLDWLGTLILWATTAIGDSTSKFEQALRTSEQRDVAFKKTQADLEESRRQSKKAENTLEDTNTRLGTAEEGWRAIKSHADRLGQECRDLKRELDSAKSQLITARRDAGDLQQQAATADSRRQSAQSALDDSRRKLKQQQDSLNHTRNELQAAQDLAAQHWTKLSEVEGNLHNANFGLADLKSRLDDQGRAIDGLRQEKEDKTKRIAALLAERQSLNETIASIQAMHQQDLAARDSKHRETLGEAHAELGRLQDQHAQELKEQGEESTACILRLEAEMADLQGQIESRIQDATRKSRETIDRQNRQIASYSKSADYTPIDDAFFNRALRNLIVEVNQLASKIPHPRTLDFDRGLDPTKCLERNSVRRDWIWPRFVRSLCWQILLRGFFSLPLGFGALGVHGEGHRRLNDILELVAQRRVDGES